MTPGVSGLIPDKWSRSEIMAGSASAKPRSDTGELEVVPAESLAANSIFLFPLCEKSLICPPCQ